MLALSELHARGGRRIGPMFGNVWHADEPKVAQAFALKALAVDWGTHGSGLDENSEEIIHVPEWLGGVRDRPVRGGAKLDLQARMGTIKVDELPAFDKFWFLILDSMRPNIDIFATAVLDNYEQNIELIKALLLYGHMRWGETGKSVVASTSLYFGRLPKITRLLDLAEANTEINFILLPKRLRNDDKKFVQASSFRANQVASLEESAMGWEVVKNQHQGISDRVTLRKQYTLSGLLIHLSRTVRAMTMKGLSTSELDVDGIMRAFPRNCENEIPNLEAVVTFASNMMLAEMSNPELLLKYLDALQLNKFLYANNPKSIARSLRNTELSLYGSVRDGWNMSELAETFAKYLTVDQDLLPLLFKGIQLQPSGQMMTAGKISTRVVDKARQAYSVAAEVMGVDKDNRFIPGQLKILEQAPRYLI